MQDGEAVRDTWDGVAAAWDRYDEELAAFTRPVRTALVDALALRPEDVVLELAGGTGGLSRAVAPGVREVVCTDVAPGMVLAASRRLEEEGPDNVRCLVADAHDLPFDDGAFDAVVCQMGLMLMPDPAAALEEAHRVLRPEGRIGVATWAEPQDNLWIVMIGGALLQHGHALPGSPVEPGGLFSLATREALEERLAGAGFSDLTFETVALGATFATFEEYWERHVATGGPIDAIVAGLPDEERTAVRETCRTNCAAFATDEGYRFSGSALVASGTA